MVGSWDKVGTVNLGGVSSKGGNWLMQRSEIRSSADLAGEGTRVVTTLVRDLHRGISSRVFDAVGPASKPVQVIHDATAAITYHLVDGAIRGSLRGAGALAAEAWSNRVPEAVQDTVQARPRVAGAVAAVNGIYGDQLADHGNEFALTMQIRRHGQSVALAPIPSRRLSRRPPGGSWSSCTAGA
jgi:hypothetical protein